MGKKVLECVDEVIVGSDARPDNLYSSLILETHHNYLLANSVLFSWYPEYFLTFYSLNEMIFCITMFFTSFPREFNLSFVTELLQYA